MISARVCTSAILVLFFLVLVLVGLTYPWGTSLAPLLVGLLGLTLSISQFFSDLRATSADLQDDSVNQPDRMVASHILWLVGLVALVLAAGQIVGSLVFLVAYVRFALGHRWLYSITFAVGVVSVLYVLFELVVGVVLFDGLLCEMHLANLPICR
jgi:hypothetical protein